MSSAKRGAAFGGVMTLLASLVGLVGLAGDAGCAPQDVAGREPEGERVGRARTAIVGSFASSSAQDSVVMLVFSDPSTNRRGICTAALIAPRLVLTARHCVAETETDVACGVEGNALAGGAVRGSHDPRKLFVFTGKERPVLDPATWKPAAQGIETFDDGASNLCNHDLALVVLEKPIEGVPIASLRLDGDVESGEGLTTVGWGVTSDALEPAVRQQRDRVQVTRIGPDDTSPVLTPNELSFDESICLGDSGGPILAERSGAVVGVVSRGGNGRFAADPASSCVDATNLATKLAPFRALVLRAFDRAGAQPRLEAPPPAKDEGCRVAQVGAFGADSTYAILAACFAALLAGRRRKRGTERAR